MPTMKMSRDLPRCGSGPTPDSPPPHRKRAVCCACARYAQQSSLLLYDGGPAIIPALYHTPVLGFQDGPCLVSGRTTSCGLSPVAPRLAAFQSSASAAAAAVPSPTRRTRPLNTHDLKRVPAPRAAEGAPACEPSARSNSSSRTGRGFERPRHRQVPRRGILVRRPPEPRVHPAAQPHLPNRARGARRVWVRARRLGAKRLGEAPCRGRVPGPLA